MTELSPSGSISLRPFHFVRNHIQMFKNIKLLSKTAKTP